MDVLQRHFSTMDIDEILKIKASPNRGEDVLAWAPDRRGIFSVRSAYKLAWESNHRTSMCAASRAPDGKRVVWDTVWGCPAPPKVRVFAWRLITNSLATWENKKRRNMEASDICVICGIEREDTYHTFCRCPMARALWEAMREVWPLKEHIPNTGQEWLFQALDHASEEERLMMLMTFWRIWHVRNEVVHQKAAPPIEASRRFLCSYVDSLLMIKQDPMADSVKGKTALVYGPVRDTARRRKKDVACEGIPMGVWSRPPEGWVKLNVDGAWTKEDCRGGTGMILRDDQGCTIFAAYNHLQSCGSPLEAELLACIEGMTLAFQHTGKPVIVESDCSEAVKMFKDSDVNRSLVVATVNEAKRLCNLGRVFQFKHISREYNIVSHSLARWGFTERQTRVWIRHGPDFIRQACIQDGNPIP
jgi:ribonuclease HI